MIFQEPMTALNPVMTVGRQVEEVCWPRTLRAEAGERRRRVLTMFEEVHLPEVERIYGSYPQALSGGQRQRIMIAMALVLKPRLLIADEPTTALDVTTQAQILVLLRELREHHGTAVLFITHDMGVVAEIADRVVVMRRGKGGRDRTAAPSAEPSGESLHPRPARRRAEPDAATAAGRGRGRGGAGDAGTGQDLPRARPVQAPRGRGRRRRRHHLAPRAHARHRRRERLGQVDGGALRRAPDRPDLGQHQARRRRHLDPVAPGAQAAPQAGPDRLPGPLPLAQPAPDGRPVDHRGGRPISASRARKRWRRPGASWGWSTFRPRR